MLVDALVLSLALILALFYASRASFIVTLYHTIIVYFVYLVWPYRPEWYGFTMDFHFLLGLLSFLFVCLMMTYQGGSSVRLSFCLLTIVHMVALFNEIFFKSGYYSYSVYLSVYEIYPVVRIFAVAFQLIGLAVDDDNEHGKRSRSVYWRRYAYRVVFNTRFNNVTKIN